MSKGKSVEIISDTFIILKSGNRIAWSLKYQYGSWFRHEGRSNIYTLWHNKITKEEVDKMIEEWKSTSKPY